MSALTSMASVAVTNGERNSLRDKIHENRSSSRQGRRELKTSSTLNITTSAASNPYNSESIDIIQADQRKSRNKSIKKFETEPDARDQPHKIKDKLPSLLQQQSHMLQKSAASLEMEQFSDKKNASKAKIGAAASNIEVVKSQKKQWEKF